MTTGSVEEELRRGLEELGFERMSTRGPGWHLRRMRPRVHDHAALVVDGSWITRLLGRATLEVRAGVVVPQVEQTFVRPVPRAPVIPGEVHAAMPPAEGRVPTAAGIAEWCERWDHPLQLLEQDMVDDPVLALEMAVVARSRGHAVRAAAAARAGLQGDDSAPGRRRSRRIETAAAQLGV